MCTPALAAVAPACAIVIHQNPTHHLRNLPNNAKRGETAFTYVHITTYQ